MSLAERVIDDSGVPEWTQGNRIWRARTHAKLEQSQVAEALGVSRALVSRWEKDLSDPRVGQLRRLAEVTGVAYDWLAGTRTCFMQPLPDPDEPARMAQLVTHGAIPALTSVRG